MTEDDIIIEKLEKAKEYFVKTYNDEEKLKLFSDLRKKTNISKLLKGYTSINRLKANMNVKFPSFYDIIYNHNFNYNKSLRQWLLNKDVDYIIWRIRTGSFNKLPCSYNSKYVYEIFNELPNITNYYDYACGWGERMLCSLGYNINYYGTDPNKSLFENLTKLKDDVYKYSNTKAICDIRNTGSEILHDDWVGKMDLCYSSPPYYDLETYADEETQSIYNRTFNEWVDQYIKPTFENCYKYLKHGGYLIVNITNSKQIKYDIETTIKDNIINLGFTYIKVENKHQTTYKTKNISKLEKQEKFYWFKKI